MTDVQAIGTMVRELDTPALLVDLEAMDRNLKRMAERLAGDSSASGLTPRRTRAPSSRGSSWIWGRWGFAARSRARRK